MAEVDIPNNEWFGSLNQRLYINGRGGLTFNEWFCSLVSLNHMFYINGRDGLTHQ